MSQRKGTTPPSKLAANRRRAERIQAATPVRPCEQCGVEFHPFPRTQGRFCTRACAGLARTRTKEASFLRFVPYGPWLGNVCHEWLGRCDADGYGFFAAEDAGQPIKAHQYAWERANQRTRPSDMCVCHTCDNPPCINEAHLFLDTAAGNAEDRTRKGRTRNHFSHRP